MPKALEFFCKACKKQVYIGNSMRPASVRTVVFCSPECLPPRYDEILLLEDRVARKQGRGSPLHRKTVKGKRPDLGDVFMRSKWEANIARVFILTGIKYEYEPKEFFFEDPKLRTNRSYTPDFYLPGQDTWVEIKGVADQTSLTKLRRFKKYFPQEFAKLRVICDREGSKTWKAIEKLGVPIMEQYKTYEKEFKGFIKEWE